MGQGDNHGADRGHTHPAQPATFLLQVLCAEVQQQEEDFIRMECHPDIMSTLFWGRCPAGHIICSHLARGELTLTYRDSL